MMEAGGCGTQHRQPKLDAIPCVSTPSYCLLGLSLKRPIGNQGVYSSFRRLLQVPAGSLGHCDLEMPLGPPHTSGMVLIWCQMEVRTGGRTQVVTYHWVTYSLGNTELDL